MMNEGKFLVMWVALWAVMFAVIFTIVEVAK